LPATGSRQQAGIRQLAVGRKQSAESSQLAAYKGLGSILLIKTVCAPTDWDKNKAKNQRRSARSARTIFCSQSLSCPVALSPNRPLAASQLLHDNLLAMDIPFRLYFHEVNTFREFAHVDAIFSSSCCDLIAVNQLSLVVIKH
jgi:hypothetical protein